MPSVAFNVSAYYVVLLWVVETAKVRLDPRTMTSFVYHVTESCKSCSTSPGFRALSAYLYINYYHLKFCPFAHEAGEWYDKGRRGCRRKNGEK